MKNDRGLGYTGDFSYSDAALRRVIDQHMHRFAPLTDMSSSWLKLASRGGLIDEELLRQTAGDPGRFHLFDYNGCHILLVQIDSNFKLVFWEGMNHLLKEI